MPALIRDLGDPPMVRLYRRWPTYLAFGSACILGGIALIAAGATNAGVSFLIFGAGLAVWAWVRLRPRADRAYWKAGVATLVALLAVVLVLAVAS